MISNTPLTCEKGLNKWKSILNKKEMTSQELEHKNSLDYCSDTILNHKFTQKLKLVDKDKFNIISNTYRCEY